MGANSLVMGYTRGTETGAGVPPALEERPPCVHSSTQSIPVAWNVPIPLPSVAGLASRVQTVRFLDDFADPLSASGRLWRWAFGDRFSHHVRESHHRTDSAHRCFARSVVELPTVAALAPRQTPSARPMRLASRSRGQGETSTPRLVTSGENHETERGRPATLREPALADSAFRSRQRARRDAKRTRRRPLPLTIPVGEHSVAGSDRVVADVQGGSATLERRLARVDLAPSYRAARVTVGCEASTPSRGWCPGAPNTAGGAGNGAVVPGGARSSAVPTVS